jgi:nickel/cobalt exporter
VPIATPKPKATVPPASRDAAHHDSGLLELLRSSDHGFWMLLILAAAVGAIHALTPGHGKTLVAAYLVGEQGTVWHALVLGLVTTLTHTGVVLVAAVALRFIPSVWVESALQVLQVLFALLIAGLGFWLLVCRLSGRADHVHLGGHGHDHHHHDHAHHHGHHHHHHDHEHHHHAEHHDHTHAETEHQAHDHEHADHDHDEQGHVIPKTTREKSLGWWGLVTLGIQGGIVPCWDAIIMLLVAVSLGLLWLALPMLLAFSAGLAAVLVGIGIAVVSAKGLAQKRWGATRLLQALPVVSACVVIALGMWLLYDSVHGLPK